MAVVGRKEIDVCNFFLSFWENINQMTKPPTQTACERIPRKDEISFQIHQPMFAKLNENLFRHVQSMQSIFWCVLLTGFQFLMHFWWDHNPCRRLVSLSVIFWVTENGSEAFWCIELQLEFIKRLFQVALLHSLTERKCRWVNNWFESSALTWFGLRISNLEQREFGNYSRVDSDIRKLFEQFYNAMLQRLKPTYSFILMHHWS